MLDTSTWQPGDIIFVWPHDLGSILTRIGQGWVNGSNPPQHVCLYAGNDKIHTTSFMYGVVNASDYLTGRKEWEVYRKPGGLTPQQATTILERSEQFFGTPYPFWELIPIALGKVTKFKPKKRLAICSYAVATCYILAGIDLWADGSRGDTSITPEQLYFDVAGWQRWELVAKRHKPGRKH